ncbi:MAG: glycoside hydrolase family 99-like domain-containing protein [Clostridia bacterium]|nr:glycoside hydrolase family 99-like domain-containing protein [Clostridia bacterium]
MKELSFIAMYLPQYHTTPENDQWWGKGFTDWTTVKTSEPLFEGHRQPRIPLGEHYYDLSKVEEIRQQAIIAKKYGISGFGIYHYWFSSNQVLLKKPAELLRENEDIDIDYFFVWDNNSWVRTWSRLKHNTNAWSPKIDSSLSNSEESMLAELKYGDETEWRKHFDYLLPFFKDKRYIKIDNKPVFSLFNYNNKEVMKKMCKYWNELAMENGFDGVFFLGRLNPYDSLDCFDALFTYEPMFSAWQNKNIANRVVDKLKDQFSKQKQLIRYDYDEVWKAIISNARKREESSVLFGGFVSYDDTPRRGNSGRVVIGESPEKFYKYLSDLANISMKQGKRFIFITAWNEWGEGAYLEPDTYNKMAYLEALQKVAL